MNNHIIINVGRQVGSGGLYIARKLAEEFGCELYDKRLLNLAAKESGFSEKFFERNDEKKGFFQTISHLHVPFVNDNNLYHNDLSDESLYKFQSDAIRKAAQQGNCVFVGRTADYILRDLAEKVDIFITAPLEDRIRRISEKHGWDEETSRKFIRDKESARESYYNYYTGKRWGDSQSYDLCINSSLLGLDKTTEYIAELIRRRLA